MTEIVARRRVAGTVVTLVVLVLLGAGLYPLLRANAAARYQAWEESCARTGGVIETLPAEQRNPLITQTGHPVQQCRAADGRVLSRRD